jgi:hypothetical protein
VVTQGRRVVRRVPPPRRRGGGRRWGVAAAILSAAIPVQKVPPIRRRHPRRRRRPSGVCSQLRLPPGITYAGRGQLRSCPNVLWWERLHTEEQTLPLEGKTRPGDSPPAGDGFRSSQVGLLVLGGAVYRRARPPSPSGDGKSARAGEERRTPRRAES